MMAVELIVNYLFTTNEAELLRRALHFEIGAEDHRDFTESFHQEIAI
jgi:hypothetical protein